MHILDFHSKLSSGSEDGHLFEALRSLSQINDPKAMHHDVTQLGEWASWPPMDAHASCLASDGV